jgi:hypothetical protein
VRRYWSSRARYSEPAPVAEVLEKADSSVNLALSQFSYDLWSLKESVNAYRVFGSHKVYNTLQLMLYVANLREKFLLFLG